MRPAAVLVAVALALAGPAAAEPAPSLFDAPAAEREADRVLRLLAGDARAEALTAAEALAARHPHLARPHLALALARAVGPAPETALDALAEAVRLGFRDAPAVLASPAFRLLAEAPGMEALAAAIAAQRPQPSGPAPAPIDIEALSAPVSARNTRWDPVERHFAVRFRVPPVLARRPAVGPIPGLERIVPFVNRWVAGGGSAGLAGVLYDNRDRGHSTLDRKHFPQLLHTAYAEPVRARRLDYGPNRLFEFDRITFGNSSTALTQGPFWRSQARRMMTEPGGIERLTRQYARNMIYVYPERFDHGERGADLFPANTPYLFASQGASGSDRPILRAIALALAAMPRTVRDRAEAEGLIAPLLQQLVRSTLRGVEGREDYLSARAHPSAFRGEDIDLERLVRRARDLRPADIAPRVHLSLVRAERPRGADRAGVVQPERLFETPSAIAWVFRASPGVRRFLLSAGATRDPLDRALRFHWRVLRGDAARIRIAPTTEAGDVAEIEIPWHDPFPVPARPEGAAPLLSHRVDIGVFAETDAGLSAPAFFSVSFPPDQRRRYDAEGRPLEIDHTHGAAAGVYADPLIHPVRDWRDVYLYGPDGAPEGWERHRPGQPTERFDVEGRLLTPQGPVAVRYALGERDRLGRARVQVVLEDAAATR